MAERKRLTPRAWAAAALEALAEGGVTAVAVEPVAARLSTTKGSFYWHFRNRDALLEAALLLWERTDTEGVITLLEAEPDPRLRLRDLLTVVLGTPAGHASARVELALQPAAAHPLVAPVLARVTRRRLDYITGLFTALGFPADEARRRSVFAFTAYLGLAQLSHATPEFAPAAAELPAYVDGLLTTLLAP